MNKLLLFPILLGNLFFFSASVVWAGTLAFTREVPFTSTNWNRTLEFPQYNPADHFGQPLTGVSVSAVARARGTYTLINQGTDEILYGSMPNRGVGANVHVRSNVLPGFLLNPVPATWIPPGTLFPSPNPPTCPTPQDPLTPCRLEQNLAGIDNQATNVNPTDFAAFTGMGSVSFVGRALSFISVSKSGMPFQENANVEAYLEIVVNYSFNDPPPPPLEIDEPYLGIFSLVALSLGGLFLGFKPSQA
jgi:hypothetical protein